MSDQSRDTTAAVEDSVRRHWEWFRDAYDLYQVEDGVAGRDPLLPSWDELSPQSRRLIQIRVAGALHDMADVALGGHMPEVRPPT